MPTTPGQPPTLLVVQIDDESGPGALEAPLRQRAALRFSFPEREPAPAPSPAATDGLLVLGGRADPAGADAPEAVDRAVRWVREALDAGTPVLGLCLGAQVLARAAGGDATTVGPDEIGWTALDVDPRASDDPLVGGVPAGTEVFQWHSWSVDLDGADVDVLARTDAATQAFRVRDRPAWGLQFHAEIEMSTVGLWAVKGREELAEHGIAPESLRAASADRIDDAVLLTRGLAERFVDVCIGDRDPDVEVEPAR